MSLMEETSTCAGDSRDGTFSAQNKGNHKSKKSSPPKGASATSNDNPANQNRTVSATNSPTYRATSDDFPDGPSSTASAGRKKKRKTDEDKAEDDGKRTRIANACMTCKKKSEWSSLDRIVEKR